MAKIGLVTVLFKSDDVLEGFISSIAEQTFKDYHLYLIDNTPSINTDVVLHALIEKYSIGNFTHIKSDSNIGVAAGNNIGIQLSIKQGCTHTLLLNNDIEFSDKDLLYQIYQTAIERGENLITPKILYFDSRKIWMAGGRLLKWTGRNMHIGTGDDANTHNQPRYFNYAPTCFMLINNTVFKNVGLMDEKYFVYYDDTDFIYRAYKQNYKIYFMPQIVVLHKVSSSTGGQDSLFATYYITRNMIYFIKKNYTGLLYLFALSYAIFSRFCKCVFADKARKEKILNGLNDGWKLKSNADF